MEHLVEAGTSTEAPGILGSESGAMGVTALTSKDI